MPPSIAYALLVAFFGLIMATATLNDDSPLGALVGSVLTILGLVLFALAA